jgi:galactokinase
MKQEPVAERKKRIAKAFERLYSVQPSFWVRAPGRVDVMGSHTDYNEGYVLTMPIDRDTWIAARPRASRTVEVSTLSAPGADHFPLDNIVRTDAPLWGNYVRGVAWALGDAGYRLDGWDGLVQSTVPIGSGLSSSAALECATATLFTALAGKAIDPVQLAQICQRAENEFVGVNCGILDQYTSILGQEGCALTLDCRYLTHRIVKIPADIMVVICDTRFHRALAASEYGARRAACEEGARALSRSYPEVKTLRDVTPAMLDAHEADLSPVVAKRCWFIVEENARVLALAQALPRGDRAAIREITVASFAGARDLYEITVREMEMMHEAMMQAPGAIGARQAGAGFGGCMVAFVEASRVASFAASVRKAYAGAAGIEPEIYPVRAAPGAGEVKD